VKLKTTSVVMPGVVMLNVVMLNALMLIVVMQSFYDAKLCWVSFC